MNAFTLLFELPLLPVKGVVRLAEVIRDEADRQLHDPAVVRRQLEEAAEARAAGEMSDREVAELEQRAVERLGGNVAAGPPPREGR